MANLLKKRIISEEKDLKEIWNRLKKRDFSGNTGLVIKNSIYQFFTNVFGKIGAFIFTIILARLLLPDLFGLYSLVLSTILIFGVFSELGIQTTLIRFVSRGYGKKKIKFYLYYLGKIKLILTIIVTLFLLISARYIANNFYQKPIFLALLGGSLYLVFNEVSGFLKSLLYASNNFSSVLKREFIFQISRSILAPLVILFAIKKSFSNDINLMLIMFLLSFSLFLASLMMFFDVKKTYSKEIRVKGIEIIPKKQKTLVNRFLFATAILALSGVFFGNIDKVMLGVFVSGKFIGYYTASFSLLSALTSLIGFSSIVLLPIFSKLKGKRLESGFKRSFRITVILSIGAFLVILAFSSLALLIIYGKEYLIAINILKILSLLIFILPLIAIYQSYHLSQGKPGVVAKFLIISTVSNIVLNYILIISLLPYGELAAVYGAAIATVVSQSIYLGGLVLWKKGSKK